MRTSETPPLKTCRDCGPDKPLEDFSPNSSTSDGRTSCCRLGRRDRQQRYRDAKRGGPPTKVVSSREAEAAQVDHDHVSRVVRGVLCFHCNGGLGQFKDRTAVLRNAIDYLETTTWQRTQVCTGVYRLRSPRPAAAASPTSLELQRLICSRRG